MFNILYKRGNKNITESLYSEGSNIYHILRLINPKFNIYFVFWVSSCFFYQLIAFCFSNSSILQYSSFFGTSKFLLSWHLRSIFTGHRFFRSYLQEMIIFTHRAKTFFTWKIVYFFHNLPEKLKNKYSETPSTLIGASIIIQDLNLPWLRRTVVAGQSPKYDKLLASKLKYMNS